LFQENKIKWGEKKTKAKNRDKKARARRGEYARGDRFKSEIGVFKKHLFSANSSFFGKAFFSKERFILVIFLLAAFSMSAVTVAQGSDFSDVRIHATSQPTEVSTSSQTYVEALDAGTLSVATTSNVTVFYSAEGSITNPNDVIRIRCTIGGNIAHTDDIKFADYSTVNVTQSAVFYYPNVPAGSPQIKIEFRSSTGQNIKLRNQTLVAVAYPTAISMAGYSTEDKKTTETTYGATNVWQVGTLNVPSATKGLFFYSAEGNVSAADEVLHVRCNASNNIANIDDIRLVDYSTMNISRGAIFYVPSLSADSYTIKLGYRSSTGDGVTLRNQTLVAAAFPALVAKDETEKSTPSQTYVEALDAGTLTLDTTSDVAVYYTAEGNISNPDDILRINCTIGDTVASISDIKFVDRSTNNVTMSAVFYRSDVSTGSCPIKIGYRSSNGNSVTLRNQTLIAISQKAAPTPPPVVAVPEFSPVGLLALIGILSAVLVIATLMRREKGRK